MEMMNLKLNRARRALLLAFCALALAPVAHAQYPPEADAPNPPTEQRDAPTEQRDAPTEQRGTNAGANSETEAAARSREVAESFARSGVYVSPDMRDRADAASIEAAVRATPIVVNVAVIGALPPQSRTVESLTRALHQQLRLGDGLMIVVSDRPRALGLYGGGLDKVALDDIAARTAKTFDSEGYAIGIKRVISLASEERASRNSASRNLLGFLFGIPALLLLFGARRAKRARARDAGAARSLAEAESTRLSSDAQALADELNEAIASETDAARHDTLQAAQDSARRAFDDALIPMKSARTAADWDAVRAALHGAEEEMRRGHLVLAQVRASRAAAMSATNAAAVPSAPPAPASGGAPNVWADSDAEIPPLGTDLPGARADYALDFFTSQPVRRDEMVPVEIELGGRQRTVWASGESAARAQHGDLSVAAQRDGDAARPWFDSPSYNPWLEVGASVLPMMALQLLMGGLLGGRNYDD